MSTAVWVVLQDEDIDTLIDDEEFITITDVIGVYTTKPQAEFAVDAAEKRAAFNGDEQRWRIQKWTLDMPIEAGHRFVDDIELPSK